MKVFGRVKDKLIEGKSLKMNEVINFDDMKITVREIHRIIKKKFPKFERRQLRFFFEKDKVDGISLYSDISYRANYHSDMHADMPLEDFKEWIK